MMDGLCGSDVELNFEHIPMAIYTHPELACVGKTEEELQKENHPYRVKYNNSSRLLLTLENCTFHCFCLFISGILD